MICKKCGFENATGENGQEKKYCLECGSSLQPEINVSTEPRISNDEHVESNTKKSIFNKVKLINFADIMAGLKSINMRKVFRKDILYKFTDSKKILIVSIIVSIILIFGISMIAVFQSNPVNRLAVGLNRMANDKKIEASSSISFDTNSKTLDNMSLKSNFTVDRKKLNVFSKIQVYYEEEKAISIDASTQDGVAYLSSKELTPEKFAYYEIEDFDDVLNDYLIVTDIIDKLKLGGLSWNKYSKAIQKGLGKDLEQKFNTITLKLDANTLEDVTLEVLDIIEDDEKLQELLKKNMLIVVDQIEKNQDDFQLIEMDNVDFEEALDYIEDDFDDDYEEFIDTIGDYENDIQMELAVLSAMGDVEFEFKLTPFNRIKSVTTIIDVAGYKTTSETKFNKGAKRVKYNLSDGIDMMDTDELMEYAQDDLLDNVDDFQDENDAFKSLVKDATREGLNSLGNLYGIFNQFDSLINSFY